MALEKSEIQKYYSFAENLIGETRKLILELWAEEEFTVDIKKDTSPVTNVDRKAEELVRDRIQKRFPDHGVIGEEYGLHNPNAEFQWTIDPIDGTQNLIHRIPTFGTILGLQFQQRSIVGWLDHPAMNLSVSAGQGLGAYRDGKAFTLAPFTQKQFAPNDILASSSLAVATRGGMSESFYKLLKFHSNTRIYYDCYSHSLSCLGSLAATVEYSLHLWDLTAVEAIVTEAGGEYRALEPIPADRINGPVHAIFGRKGAVDLMYQALRE